MSDELDSIVDEQAQVEAAAGAVHLWRDRCLEPFSYGRQCCYERLGLRYESVLECATAIVYLCLLSGAAGKERMNRARGAKGTQALLDEISEWAEREDISMHNKHGDEVATLAEKIWADIAVSRFVPEPKKDDKPSPKS